MLTGLAFAVISGRKCTPNTGDYAADGFERGSVPSGKGS
jgi:hypothetical protein